MLATEFLARNKKEEKDIRRRDSTLADALFLLSANENQIVVAAKIRNTVGN